MSVNSIHAVRLSVVALCILVSLSAVPIHSTSSSDYSTMDAEMPAEGLRFKAHDMTMSEMTALREAWGVRDSSSDYNVIVDGFGTGLAPPSAEGWLSMVGKVRVLDSIDYDLGSIPGSFDLSVLPTFPVVGNQRTQPSCSAWAAAYYAYGFQEAVDNGWVQAGEGAEDQLISPSWTYSRSNDGRDLGSSMDENMMVIADWGAPTLSTMPFDEYEYLYWGPPEAFREAPAHRAAEVFTIVYSGQSTIDEIKTLVTEGIPVTFGIDAYQYYNFEGDWILSSEEYNSTSLNHAQTIVGFDDNVTDDNDTGAFRVVNSWGSSWGDSGFYWLTYDTMIELGDIDRAVLNYVTDIEDYVPSTILTWHFDPGPSRAASMEVGIGPPSAPVESKVPFFTYDSFQTHLYPEFMSLDVSEFSDSYDAGEEDFYISIGTSLSKGYLTSFKVSLHEGAFIPGSPTHSSGQSPDVPTEMNPFTVTNSLHYYTFMSADEAMDSSGLEFLSTGEASWVAVDHHSHDGFDSMQTGDIAGLESSALMVDVVGPVNVSFMWKISSQSGGDLLSFSVAGTEIEEQASGEMDWEEVTVALGEGSYTLLWNYSKDSSVDSLQDTAWIDLLSVVQPVPSFSLESHYEVIFDVPLVVTPLDVLNPAGGNVSFWYVWGDGAEGPGDSEAPYSGSHAYAEMGDYDLNVYMEDCYGTNVSESSTVAVVDDNQKPEIISLDVSPALAYHAPGSTLWINITVRDTEGDDLRVVVETGDGETHYFSWFHSEPKHPEILSLPYSYDEGDEAAYVVVVTVYDDASHSSPGWNVESVEVLVNTLPFASFVAYPLSGDVGSLFSFDASFSSDNETEGDSIQVRWDWEGDGIWDTEWSTERTATHVYALPGWYEVTLQVRDINGLMSSTTVEVEVTGEPIPEFPFLLLPVLALLLVFAFARRKARQRD